MRLHVELCKPIVALFFDSLMIGRFAMGGYASTNVDEEHKTVCYPLTVCGARKSTY